MAYETERARFYSLLTQKSGIARGIRAELVREADERALEARQQVGLEATGTSTDLIVHPTAAQRTARLGGAWTGIPVTELATWNYLWLDPIQAAVNGLWNSQVHHDILANPVYKHWGLGIYSELKTGEAELFRRWYLILWLSTAVPSVISVCPPSMTPIYNRKVVINIGTNICFRPELGPEDIESTTVVPIARYLLGSVTGDTYNGISKWYVLYETGRGWRYVNSHPDLVSAQSRIE